ncbi:unnamed protein product [Trichobilharzia regenti]|nr:unnamed protein product [Trichobilharzia regenti]
MHLGGFWYFRNQRVAITDDTQLLTCRVVDRASAWCGSLGVPFFRLSPPLSADVCLDSTDVKQLLQMVVETQAYLHRVRDRIELLASLL